MFEFEFFEPILKSPAEFEANELAEEEIPLGLPEELELLLFEQLNKFAMGLSLHISELAARFRALLSMTKGLLDRLLNRVVLKGPVVGCKGCNGTLNFEFKSF